MEKDKELAKEKELEEKERKKRESVSTYNRDKLDSTNSDDGMFPGGNRRNRRGRLESTAEDGFMDDDDESVFGGDGGPNRKDSVKGGPKNRNDSDNKLERKDSEKPKRGKKTIKEKGPDMTRTARTISGVFYWDRQQNQKSNSTFSGR